MTSVWEEVNAQAQALHDRSVVIDGLAGSAMAYPTLIAGGLTAVNVTVAGSAVKTLKAALKNITEYYDLIALDPQKLKLVEGAGDIEKAKESGQLGIILGFQGAACLEEELSMLQVFQRMGVRILGLTYSEQNTLGYGCLERYDPGLTHFGIQVVRECNRLGLLIDLTHVGNQTALDAADLSEQPVVLTHSNARELCDNPRNVSDELIRAVAASGGVIGVTAYASLTETTPNQWATVDDMVSHIVHVAGMVGIEHVGFGTDMFEGRSQLSFETSVRRKYLETFRPYSSVATRHVQGLGSLRYMPRLTAALLRRGFSEADVQKVLGGNFLRVFRQVWA